MSFAAKTIFHSSKLFAGLIFILENYGSINENVGKISSSFRLITFTYELYTSVFGAVLFFIFLNFHINFESFLNFMDLLTFQSIY